MPTYRYRRPDGSTFDVLQKISEDPLTEDPQTGEPVERVISGGAGLQFKGSGFYLTDYVQKSGSADAAEPGGPKKKGDGGAKKSEPAKAPSEPKPAKPEAKAASKPASGN